MKKSKHLSHFEQALLPMGLLLWVSSYCANGFMFALSMLVGCLFLKKWPAACITLLLFALVVQWRQPIVAVRVTTDEGQVMALKEYGAIVDFNGAKVLVKTSEPLQYKETIKVMGSFEPITSKHNFYTFDYASWLQRQGIGWQMNEPKFERIAQPFAFRNLALKRIQTIQNEALKTLLLQLFVYQSGGNGRYDALVITTTMGISALKTMGFSLLTSFVAPYAANALLFGCFLLYGVVFAFPYALFRTIFALACRLWGGGSRQQELALVIIASLVLFPGIQYSASFLFPILLGMLYRFDVHKTFGWTRMVLLVVLQALLFQKVNLASVLWFPIVLKGCGLLYLLGMVAIVVPHELTYALLQGVLSLLAQVDRMQYVVVFTMALPLALLSIVALFAYGEFKRGRALLLCASCIMLAYVGPKVSWVPTVVFFDVGQGDAAFIDYGFGRPKVMVDMAGTGYSKNVEQIVSPYFTQHGIGKLDALVVSHDDLDHSGEVEALQALLPIEAIVTTKNTLPFALTPYARELLETSLFEDVNDNSLILLSKVGSLHYLFTGDISQQVEKKLLQQYPNLKADILKVAHHGSKTSTDPAFLHQLEPRVAFIGAKKNNRYHHPHPEVMDLLQREHIKTFVTAENGAIKVYHFPFFNLIRTARGEFVIMK